MTATPPKGFDWDCAKYEINRRKHQGLTFDVAIFACLDPNGFDYEDRVEDGEHRWSWLGLTPNGIMLYISYTMHDDDRIKRIISARKAEGREQRAYFSR